MKGTCKVITFTLKKPMGFNPDGTEITKEILYYAPPPKAIVLRQALQLKNLDINTLTTEDADLIVQTLVEIFGNQFTANDVWQGILAEDFVELPGIIAKMLDGTYEKLDAIPNAQGEAEKK
jgi:hypothetical protein